MSPEQARAMYERMIGQHGEDVTLRRYTGTGGSRAISATATVRARVTGYDPTVLAGQMQQGDRRLIVLAEDLEEEGFTLPITSNDRVVFDGKELAVHVPDDATRRIAGVVIAYDLIARGA